jgi:hypothetical protein
MVWSGGTVMHELKTLHPKAIPAALEKAMRYRLLNEPMQAESICRDILAIEPGNQKALVTLILALTDQFAENTTAVIEDANAAVSRLSSDYERAYYSGILCERRARTWIAHKRAGWGPAAHSWLQKAMTWYEKAQQLSEDDDGDDPILRWNTCVRALQREPQIAPLEEAPLHPIESE